jgi:hypothetical protein
MDVEAADALIKWAGTLPQGMGASALFILQRLTKSQHDSASSNNFFLME